MSVAQWLLPVLWREHDWRAALERLAQAASRSPRKAIELARACEYIDPDRRRAIAAYELGGERKRARELAGELGWWSARARLAVAARAAAPSVDLALEEAEAWWDAGHPDLCALALAGLAANERGPRGGRLAALVAERDLADHAAECVADAASLRGAPAADLYVMAARLSRAAGQLDNVMRWLEAAVEAEPKHAIAARFLLELARRERGTAAVERMLRVRLERADLTTWIDGTRTAAFALIESDSHRGFGLRLLKQALERAYECRATVIPGHIAMWTVLAAHAALDGTRRELLPFVISALQVAKDPVDRVWLAALATEISLRDAKTAVVAGAYAEIVAEHAPEHPILRELVSNVAGTVEDEPTSPITVPAAAIAAAKVEVEAAIEIDINIDDAYAEAEAAPDSVDELDSAAVIWDKPGTFEVSEGTPEVVERRDVQRIATGQQAPLDARTEADRERAAAAEIAALHASRPEADRERAAAAEIAALATQRGNPKPAEPVRAKPGVPVDVARAKTVPAEPAPTTPEPRGKRAAADAAREKPVDDSRAPAADAARAKPVDDTRTKPPAVDAARVKREPPAAEPVRGKATEAKPDPVRAKPGAAAEAARELLAAEVARAADKVAAKPEEAATTASADASGGIPSDAIPKEAPHISTMPLPEATRRPSVAPASLAKPPEPAKPAAIATHAIANPASIIPTISKKLPPKVIEKRQTGALPPISRAVPVLAALRTPDRPAVPPRPADPPNAKLRAHRITIPIDVRLSLPNGSRADGHSKDISTTGLYVMTHAELAVGDELLIDLQLPGKEAFTEEEFSTRARIARKGPDGYGLELVAPDPALVAALDDLG